MLSILLLQLPAKPRSYFPTKLAMGICPVSSTHKCVSVKALSVVQLRGVELGLFEAAERMLVGYCLKCIYSFSAFHNKVIKDSQAAITDEKSII
jgi:hypothetical protein